MSAATNPNATTATTTVKTPSASSIAYANSKHPLPEFKPKFTAQEFKELLQYSTGSSFNYTVSGWNPDYFATGGVTISITVEPQGGLTCGDTSCKAPTFGHHTSIRGEGHVHRHILAKHKPALSLRYKNRKKVGQSHSRNTFDEPTKEQRLLAVANRPRPKQHPKTDQRHHPPSPDFLPQYSARAFHKLLEDFKGSTTSFLQYTVSGWDPLQFDVDSKARSVTVPILVDHELRLTCVDPDCEAPNFGHYKSNRGEGHVHRHVLSRHRPKPKPVVVFAASATATTTPPPPFTIVDHPTTTTTTTNGAPCPPWAKQLVEHTLPSTPDGSKLAYCQGADLAFPAPLARNVPLHHPSAPLFLYDQDCNVVRSTHCARLLVLPGSTTTTTNNEEKDHNASDTNTNTHTSSSSSSPVMHRCEACQQLPRDATVETAVKRANTADLHTTPIHNDYLTYTQLERRLQLWKTKSSKRRRSGSSRSTSPEPTTPLELLNTTATTTAIDRKHAKPSAPLRNLDHHHHNNKVLLRHDPPPQQAQAGMGPSPPQQTTVPCPVPGCQEAVSKERARHHAAYHLLHNKRGVGGVPPTTTTTTEVSPQPQPSSSRYGLCGYCAAHPVRPPTTTATTPAIDTTTTATTTNAGECSVWIETRKTKAKTEMAHVRCHVLGDDCFPCKRGRKSSPTQPSTNVPLACPACCCPNTNVNVYIWKYNFQDHWDCMHQDQVMPPHVKAELVVAEEEWDGVERFVRWGKDRQPQASTPVSTAATPATATTTAATIAATATPATTATATTTATTNKEKERQASSNMETETSSPISPKKTKSSNKRPRESSADFPSSSHRPKDLMFCGMSL
jgi:hypothetical protein